MTTNRAHRLTDADQAELRKQACGTRGRKLELDRPEHADKVVLITPAEGIEIPGAARGDYTFLVQDYVVRSGIPGDFAIHTIGRMGKLAAKFFSCEGPGAMAEFVIGYGSTQCECGKLHPLIVHSSEIGEPVENQPPQFFHLVPHTNAGQEIRGERDGDSHMVLVVDWASRCWAKIPLPERHDYFRRQSEAGRRTDDLLEAVWVKMLPGCSSPDCNDPLCHYRILHESELMP